MHVSANFARQADLQQLASLARLSAAPAQLTPGLPPPPAALGGQRPPPQAHKGASALEPPPGRLYLQGCALPPAGTPAR